VKFLTINDSLAPIRLLRQVQAVEDAELDGFLADELEFRRRAAAQGQRWIDVLDCRGFWGLSPAQRERSGAWLGSQLPLLGETSLGVALALPDRLEAHAQRLASILGRAEIPTHVGTELESALYWALDRMYDEDIEIAPALVLGGIDALRQTLA
jgi:hypothetical protein